MFIRAWPFFLGRSFFSWVALFFFSCFVLISKWRVGCAAIFELRDGGAKAAQLGCRQIELVAGFQAFKPTGCCHLLIDVVRTCVGGCPAKKLRTHNAPKPHREEEDKHGVSAVGDWYSLLFVISLCCCCQLQYNGWLVVVRENGVPWLGCCSVIRLVGVRPSLAETFCSSHRFRGAALACCRLAFPCLALASSTNCLT